MSTSQPNSTRYPIQLQFNAITNDEFKNAQELIAHECMATKQWQRVNCLGVENVKGDTAGTFYALKIKIGQSLDWTSEGAYAFKPEKHIEIDRYRSPEEQSCEWGGQIIEFDEKKSVLYVDIVGSPPQKGDWFYICPFDFHRCINRLYNDPKFSSFQRILPARLAASRGGGANQVNAVPTILDTVDAGLAELRELWKYRWGIIWGPPGTGKTYTIGRQIASILADEKGEPERILVVSTTNRAIDAAAVELGKAAQAIIPKSLNDARLLRVGQGAKHATYKEHDLLKMLEGSNVKLMKSRDLLQEKWSKAKTADEKAEWKRRLEKIKEEMKTAWRADFLKHQNTVICCTAFAAIQMLTDDNVLEMLQKGTTPFTTVFIDESGLISRIACAALSLLASRRVVLVGDSKQLSPMSRISRVHPPHRATWLVSSGLSFLEDIPVKQLPQNIHFLKVQRRMHPEIGEIISNYMYDKMLLHHETLVRRSFQLCKSNESIKIPRAFWCILDQETPDKGHRAIKGPNGRSWIREGTEIVLEKLFSNTDIGSIKGLYITPFQPQAQLVQSFFAQKEVLGNWSASTVHSQQGQEADMVIFDTVYAGSHGWQHPEWKRLINVALSRAKHMILVLASKDEMEQSYLSPLLPYLTHCVIDLSVKPFPYRRIDITKLSPVELQPSDLPANSLGRQIAERKQLRPLLSQEQQRLCNSKIDGSPRLVRGVAGSGKTAILGEWLVQCLNRRLMEPNNPDRLPYWVVFANRSLEVLLDQFVKSAWKKEHGDKLFPDESIVKFLHIREILEKLKADLRAYKIGAIKYDYDKSSLAILNFLQGKTIEPHCEALFVDEGQDMGENTLKLLFSLVAPDPSKKSTGDKPVYIFYDNAQNVYGRSKPRWKEMGINVQGGRSTVMKESFRSTRDISEFALNTFYRLKPDEVGSDDMQLEQHGLIRKIRRNNEEWWNVHFNNIDGPKPEFKVFDSKEAEFSRLGDELVTLLAQEKVSPKDICILCNPKRRNESALKRYVIDKLPRSFDLALFPSDLSSIDKNQVLVQTPHSFKGFDSEIVFIPSAELFTAVGDDDSEEKEGAEILASPLYVAMTRARSILKISATLTGKTKTEGRKIIDVLQNCYATLCSPEEDDTDGVEPTTFLSD